MPKIAIALVAALALATSASAQSSAPQSASTQNGLGGLGGLGDLGGLGGLLGGALPSVGSIGAGNAAGLLGYCLKNNLLGQGGALGALTGGRNAAARAGGSAQSILQRLTGRQGVRTSPGYAAGQKGEVQAPNGQAFSLDDLGGQVKTRMCSVVLNRAKAFL
jgi:hypothetical protein